MTAASPQPQPPPRPAPVPTVDAAAGGSRWGSSRAGTAALTGLPAAVSAVAAALLLLPGVVSFGPVFGGADGYIAAGGGVLLGLVIAVLARRFRWALASTVAVAVGAYLLFGGALALRKTTIAGVVPTLDTLLRLVPLSVQSWRDLLTVSPPASSFVGPAVVPYLSGLVLSLVATWFALDARRHLWALAPALGLLVVGILWGLDEAPLAAFLGAGFGVVALSWAVWRRLDASRAVGEEIMVGSTSGLDRRRFGGALGMVAGAAAASLFVAPMLGGADRQVLRQVVQPPLNLADYASPLTSYRYLELDQKDVTLFTVSGLTAGTRLRLATLDAYDGHVYNVADASSGFLRIGERTLASGQGTPATLQVAVQDYSGMWVPGGGDVRGVRFTGAQAATQADTLYYNAYGGTLLTTAGLVKGDAYSVDLMVPKTVEANASLKLGRASEPVLEKVPDIINKTATDFVGEAATPLDQLRAIEKKLQEGYYSNGADQLSRAGHTAERVASMLTAPQLIGDDEQYAVAMALMARQLNIPVRVVMGFYPDADAASAGSLDVKGTMAHVWVEAPFDGAGWLSFDPTPDRNRTPQTLVPKPKPNPKPQVLPPPDPPVNKAADPLDKAGDRSEGDKQGDNLLLRVLLGVGIGLGALGLVSSPFVTIGLLKRRRRTRRQNAEPFAARVSGAWAELTDAATDLGAKLSPIATRRETADALAALHPTAQPHRLAAIVDAGVFGAATPSADWAEGVWGEVDTALASMRGGVGRWRRIRAFCSLRSFGRPHVPRLALKKIDLSGVVKRPGRKAAA